MMSSDTQPSGRGVLHVSRETSVVSSRTHRWRRTTVRNRIHPLLLPARVARRCAGTRLPAPRDDHGGGRIQVVPSTCHHPGIHRAQRLHHTPVLVDLPLRAFALDRQHPSPGAKQRHAPLRQLVQRRHRSGHDRVHLPHLLPHGLFFGSATDHGDIHAEVVDDLSEEIGAPQIAARSVSPASPAGPTLTVSPEAPLHYRCRQSARPGLSNSARATLLRRCRSHSRSASRGPMRPRSTPAPARIWAYRLGSSRPSRRAARAAGGGADTSTCFT